MTILSLKSRQRGKNQFLIQELAVERNKTHGVHYGLQRGEGSARRVISVGEEREWACHRTQGVPSCDEEDVEGIRPVLVRAGDQWEMGEVIREG